MLQNESGSDPSIRSANETLACDYSNESVALVVLSCSSRSSFMWCYTITPCHYVIQMKVNDTV